MKKTILIFLWGLICFQTVKAQKADTVLLYMTNQNKIVTTKDSAEYFLEIMMPPDSSKGVKINRINEFYTDGKPKLIGSAMIIINGTRVKYEFDGPKIDYYPNGHKRMMASYSVSVPISNISQYYPSGHLYSVSKYDNGYKLIECRDSTGNILAQNGNGKWLKFTDDFKHKTEEGMIKDSLEDSEWQTFVNDSAKYILVYKHGIPISSSDPNWKAKQVFMAVEQEPRFKSGPAGFDQYLSKAIKFPAVDRHNGTQGKIIITFVVEKDGTLSDVKALRGPSQDIMDAGVEAVRQSPPWIPGMQNGKPVRVQYTISFAFSLADN